MIMLDNNKNLASQSDSIRGAALAQAKIFREGGDSTFYLTSAMSRGSDLKLSNDEATFELIIIRLDGSVGNIRKSARYALFKVYQALKKRTRPAIQIEDYSEFTLLGIQALVEKAIFPIGSKTNGI